MVNTLHCSINIQLYSVIKSSDLQVCRSACMLTWCLYMKKERIRLFVSCISLGLVYNLSSFKLLSMCCTCIFLCDEITYKVNARRTIMPRCEIRVIRFTRLSPAPPLRPWSWSPSCSFLCLGSLPSWIRGRNSCLLQVLRGSTRG